MTLRVLSIVLVFIFFAPVPPIVHSQPRPEASGDLKSTVKLLKKHIGVDEWILESAMNNIRTKQTRAKLKERQNEFQNIIDRFNFYFSSRDPQLIKDLQRIKAEEKDLSEKSRLTNRSKRTLRSAIKKNLKDKKRIYDYAEKMTRKMGN